MSHSSISKRNVRLNNVNNHKPGKWKHRLKEIGIWVAVGIFTVAYSAIVPNL